ncbi:MAG: Beta-barrel assembly-enhancing protease [Candidatus Anoxychlamydiales bacterium]|nr:Beta-barrel assembly-enhancing protease [Candidatus Anoxychlamydiales bacterium]
MLKYRYRKYCIILTLTILTISITISYHVIQVKWIAYRKAEDYFNETRYTKAIEYYLKALKKDLDPKYIMNNLAFAAVIVGVYDPIVEIYKKLLIMRPNDDDLIEGLSNFYIQFEEFDEAIELLQDYLKKFPDDYYIRYLLAQSYCLNGEYNKAVFEYKKVLKEDIHDLRIKEKRVRLEFARVLTFAKKYDEAIIAYQDLLKTQSRNWEVQIELVNVYFKQKNYRKAFLILKEIPINELDDSSQIVLADLYAYFKDYEEAKEIYLSYLEKDPFDRKVYLKYSQMITWTNDSNSALEVLDNIKYVYSSNDESLHKLGEDYFFARKYQNAIRVFKHLIKRGTIDPSMYLDLANVYLAMDDKDEAILYLQKAYEMDPTDDKYKRKLALHLAWNKNYIKALPLLIELYKDDSDDQIVGLELVRSYADEKDIKSAQNILNELVDKFPDSPNVKMARANIYTQIGYAQKANEIYQNLLNTAKYKDTIYLGYADAMHLWGDFYKSEKMYREILKEEPDNFDAKFKLAWNLVSQKRYEESNQIYKMLLSESKDVDQIYFQLAKVNLLQKKPKNALRFANKAFVINPNDKNSLLLGRCLVANKQYKEAFQYFQQIEEKKYKKQADIEMGKVLLKQNKELAQVFFQDGYILYPNSIELYFYSNISKIKDDDFIDSLIKKAKNAEELSKIAWIYADLDLNQYSILFFQKAIQRDNNYYPAKFGLAQRMSVDNQIDAVEKFDELLKVFPQSYQLLLWKAKILGWTKHYQESLKIYSILENLNPKNPQIIREKARVAMWDKNMALALQIYNRALTPSVDSNLYNYFLTHEIEFENQKLQNDIENLKKSNLYFGYEKIKSNLNTYKITKDQKKILKRALLQNQAEFEIQKSIYLEERAKYLLYQMHYIKANEVYKELVEFSPWNAEALFDYAQTFCYLDLCDQSRSVYKVLVEDFYHNRAKLALERNIIKSSPYFRAFHRYYQEEGRGDLDRVKRNRTDLTFGFAWKCRYNMAITAKRWVEKPTYEKNTQIKDVEQLKGISYDAYGYSLDFAGTFSKYVSASAGFSQKYYLNKFNMTNLGHLNLWFRVYDLFKLNLGYLRENQIDNIFSLRNDVQINRLFLQSNTLIRRRFSIEALVEAQIYSDNNFIDLFRLDLGFRLTEFPQIFKVELRGEYRNSNKLNNFIFEGTDLINIIHPYWTPNNYKAFLASMIWYHDLSKFQFCAAEKHYYEFRLSSGTDTEKNPTITFEGGWFLEFRKKGQISLNGYITRSKIWDAQSIWAEYKFHF